MFESSNDTENNFVDDLVGGDAVRVIFSVAKWGVAILLIAVLLIAPALVAYCRWGADADADGSVSRAEYDANVATVLGTGILSYLKPVMAFWEKVVFILLPVVETP